MRWPPAARRPPEPDLAYLYAPAAAEQKKPPLDPDPRVTGSRLNRANDGREAWPGQAARFLLGGDLDELALPLPGQTGPDARRPVALRAGGIFHETVGQDFHGRLIRTLTRAGGYHRVPLEAVTAHSDCLLFAWDWRKGMVAGAAELERLIERQRTLRRDPALRVDIDGRRLDVDLFDPGTWRRHQWSVWDPLARAQPPGRRWANPIHHLRQRLFPDARPLPAGGDRRQGAHPLATGGDPPSAPGRALPRADGRAGRRQRDQGEPARARQS